ncbi:MAG: hypothetical protein ABIE03_03460 [Patescibacteria group bacterium]|nr:hypothetical protein [Patescibacteria group bacterium]
MEAKLPDLPDEVADQWKILHEEATQRYLALAPAEERIWFNLKRIAGETLGFKEVLRQREIKGAQQVVNDINALAKSDLSQEDVERLREQGLDIQVIRKLTNR